METAKILLETAKGMLDKRAANAAVIALLIEALEEVVVVLDVPAPGLAEGSAEGAPTPPVAPTRRK